MEINDQKICEMNINRYREIHHSINHSNVMKIDREKDIGEIDRQIIDHINDKYGKSSKIVAIKIKR